MFQQLRQASTAIDMLPQKLNPAHLATASPNPAPTGHPQIANPNAATKQDLQAVIQRQAELVQSLNQIKNQLGDLGTKSNQIIVRSKFRDDNLWGSEIRNFPILSSELASVLKFWPVRKHLKCRILLCLICVGSES